MIRGRISQYCFIENVDFVAFDSAPQNGGVGNRGHRIEYSVTLNIAKELAMVERNEKGK
jgi:anti-repressor protein